MKMRNIIISLLTGAALCSTSMVFAHANVQPKDILDNFAGRQFKEGSRAVIGMIVGHGCSNMVKPEGPRLPTVGLSVLLPDPTAYPEIFQPRHFGAKPRLNASWRTIKSVKGPLAQTVESHGHTITEDARAIYWLKGELRDDQYENFELRLRLPKLANGAFSCVRVFVPSVQYCRKKHVLAWIGQSTSKFPADPNDRIKVYGFPRDSVPEGEASAYAPSFYIKRSGTTADCNEICNPRSNSYDPDQCLEVRPDASEIDSFLNTRPRLPSTSDQDD